MHNEDSRVPFFWVGPLLLLSHILTIPMRTPHKETKIHKQGQNHNNHHTPHEAVAMIPTPLHSSKFKSGKPVGA